MPSPSLMLVNSPLPSPQTRESTPSASSVNSSTKRKRTLINEAYKALKEDDEYDGIGLNVACKLRRMNEEQRLFAESLINKIILYGIRQKLQEETHINGLVPTQSQNASPSSSSQISRAAHTPILTIPNRENLQPIIPSLSQSMLQDSSAGIISMEYLEPSQTVEHCDESSTISQYILFKK